jgi:hypothetical protein
MNAISKTCTLAAVLGVAALAAAGRGVADDSFVLSSQEIRQGIKKILEQDQKLHGGWFQIWDPRLQHSWRLKHVSVHDRVAYMDSPVARRMLAQAGIRPVHRSDEIVYFGCNNFRSAEGTLVDVDVWMVRSGDKLSPIDYQIHKVSGKPRYTFQNDEVVPVEPERSE